jgi:formate-dependent phosphoribosylglycinamide formyltransferase (GAR transformylase)
MTHYHQVPRDRRRALTDAVRWIQDKVWVDRLEATIEAHTSRPRRSGRTARSRHVGAHGVAVPRQAVDEGGAAGGRGPTAASTAADTADQVHEFADAVGYPLILKPRTGAGALDTTRVDNKAELDEALGRFGGQGVSSIAVEEFVEGHEGFYDTVSIDGRASLDFVSHYYPNVLDAMRTRWISPQFISTNRVDTAPDYAELRELGARVNEALGIGTSATHMEWFFGPKGLRFSEIGCRPPGVGAWDLYSDGNDLDLYREWANAVVHGHIATRPSRQYATGIVALRPDRDGTSPATPASTTSRPARASG